MRAQASLPRPLAISMGDPAGIGPEIIVKSLSERGAPPAVVVGAAGVMVEAAKRWGSKSLIRAFSRPETKVEKALEQGVILYPADNLDFPAIHPGRPGGREGKSAIKCLESALGLCVSDRCGALVTAPVTKYSLLEAGFGYPGHTDWLAARTGGRAVMMLASPSLRVAALTAHVPLRSVAKAIRRKLILEVLAIIDAELRTRFRVKAPRIAVAGLNPHAGEEGRLGSEEREIIEPALEAARRSGINVTGPHPADTMFTPQARKNYDAALCMYHDQAMLPIKTLGLDRAVNITLGLPIIRTSPAHGTALDKAWQGKADHRGMLRAIKTAALMARR